MTRWRALIILPGILVFLSMYVAIVDRLSMRQRGGAAVEATVYVPPLAQLAFSLGDKYLAANINVFRVFMMGAGAENSPVYALAARLQLDAAYFNGGHEDNYYVAAAILPWAGYVRDADYILEMAMQNRPWDNLPPFFRAFSELHFHRNPSRAAEILVTAAKKLPDQGQRISMESLAAQWAERGNLITAARMQRLLAQNTGNPAFRAYLSKRAIRTERLAYLRRKAEQYAKFFGHPIESPNDLVRTKLIAALPEDPLGGGYTKAEIIQVGR